MALSATLYRFHLELADIDRNVYESLDLRVARHPSEDDERMVVRVLARLVAHADGLEFGRGLSNVEEPTLWVKGAGDSIETWIDVGTPTAERLHRAAKLAREVRVFSHKPASALRKAWSQRSIHRAEAIGLTHLAPEFVAELARDLPRSMTWYVTIQEGALIVSDGARSLDAPLEYTTIAAFMAMSAP